MKQSPGAPLRWRLRNAVWGAKWGVGLAAALGVVAAIPALIRAFVPVSEAWKRGLSFPMRVLVYLGTGLGTGALVGFFRDVAETWWGRRVLGTLIGIPVTGVVIAAFLPEWLSLRGLLIPGAIWGFCMSFAFEAVSPRRRRRGQRYWRLAPANRGHAGADVRAAGGQETSFTASDRPSHR